eukprot:2068015-Prymnesium_polylepis.1
MVWGSGMALGSGMVFAARYGVRGAVWCWRRGAAAATFFARSSTRAASPSACAALASSALWSRIESTSRRSLAISLRAPGDAMRRAGHVGRARDAARADPRRASRAGGEHGGR